MQTHASEPMDDVNERVATFEARLVLVEKRVEELHTGLIGSVQHPGALEMIRQTSKSVNDTAQRVGSLCDSFEEVKRERWTIKGVLVAASLLSGFLAWMSTMIIGWIKP